MPTITLTDTVSSLGMLLRFTMDSTQEPSLEDIQERDAFLRHCNLETIEQAARFGGVNLKQAQILAVKVKKEHLEIMDTPDNPHPVDGDFINAALAAGSDWNERHPEEEPSLEEWIAIAGEAVNFMPADMVELEVAEAAHEG